jgi:hypothetical protein
MWSTKAPPKIPFRLFLESPDYCGLELSPLVAAVADASEGIRPTTITDEESVRHFGCPLDMLPKTPPRTVAIRAGGRAGKSSRLIAPKMLHAGWTVPLPNLRRGEECSVPNICPDLSLARQDLAFELGYAQDSPILRRALVGDPTKDSFLLRRQDKKLVRFTVAAASRGGKGGRSRTLASAAMDESGFFYDELSGAINDADIYRPLLQRVELGGQVWIVSTPWLADTGLLESLVAKNFGTHQNALVCVGGTRAFNPNWDPTGEVERDLREVDPVAASREIDGIPLDASHNAFFDMGAIRQAADGSISLPAPRRTGKTYRAGCDWGFRRHSSAIVVVERAGNRHRVVAVEELRPSPGHPLRPSAVVEHFVRVASDYGLTSLSSDRHNSESNRESLENAGFSQSFVPDGSDGKERTHLYARKLLHEGMLSLPDHPRLLGQLRSIVSRPKPGGGLSITSPDSLSGGHGDIASALICALWALRHAAATETPDFVPRVHLNGGVDRQSIGFEELDALLDDGADGVHIPPNYR